MGGLDNRSNPKTRALSRRGAIVTSIVKEAQWPLFRQAVSVTVEVRTADGTGAGALLTSNGLILTALHVVAGGKPIYVRRCRFDVKTRTVRLKGRYRADVVARDRQADIAIIKLRQPPAGLPRCRLGDSRKLRHGSALYRVGRDNIQLASGYILNFGTNAGIREIEVGMPTDDGASGGPVFDAKGRLVAVALRAALGEKQPMMLYAIPLHVVARRIFRQPEVERLLHGG